ncbi:iron chelate uptake ABC transporter family permease subunit [Kineosporia mesophila]|uniref:Iron chelate uptake ABC transporter family permease subunit n=1 Tax=Kineosporia mesophila TaxID=566012 RepID=A0ABP7AK17_9ACTN|nr:iron chelate uptake ABC transporter family permease subunit [Kineosporia mesophila]MCD5355026.1 iron chelate uptake ABC transporter family permease subunit [Kineosporia mesophila]
MTTVPGFTALKLPGGFTLRLHRRSTVTVAALLTTASIIVAVTVATGAYEITRSDLLHTLMGGGSDMDQFIVLRQRLPRAVAAVLVGAALGLSGAVFQSISRNPLGSPDVVGFATGSASGGLIVILLAGTSSFASIATGTVTGGFATALFVYALSAGHGKGGERLILTGIAVGAMLSSVNDYLITRATLEDAETAKAWQFGSLNTITWPHVTPVLVVLAVLVPLTLALAGPMRVLEMGDDAASGLGVEVARVRILLLAAGVALAGVAVATSGPIGFLAMAAPQLARKVAHSPGIALLPSMAMGAVLLSAGDLLAQRLLSPFQIPVGLVTAALGGLYLLWVLTWRKG